MLVAYGVQQQFVVYFLDNGFVPFVAKAQKVKTRKNRDYYILRVSLPKDVASKMGVGAGEHVFFKAKKAEWYHMLDWSKMETTWKMLPPQVRNQVLYDGLPNPEVLAGQVNTAAVQGFGSLATSPSLAGPESGLVMLGFTPKG